MANKIDFLKPAEPSFIKKIKEKIGYKEGPTVSEKFQKMEGPLPGDDVEKDDEKPVVVQLKKGDLNEEEAKVHEEFTGRKRKLEEPSRDEKRVFHDQSPDIEDGSGRILFKKPSKSKRRDSTARDSTKKSQKKSQKKGQKKKDDKPQKKPSLMQQVNNPRLLSFDGDESTDVIN
eukprot:m.11763 g.11763  ORF g.11763 m.11763 type:complete len:174 (+) comp23589_c0_seq2:119-640(+)